MSEAVIFNEKVRRKLKGWNRAMVIRDKKRKVVPGRLSLHGEPSPREN